MPPPVCAHVRDGVAHPEVAALEIGIDNLVPLDLARLVQGFARPTNPGVVDKCVEPAVAPHRLRDQFAHLGILTHISRNEPCLASDPLNQGNRLFPFRGRSRGNGDCCSFSREQAGDGTANPTSRAGDDGDFSVQLRHAVSIT